jgi:hypothetical protein
MRLGAIAVLAVMVAACASTPSTPAPSAMSAPPSPAASSPAASVPVVSAPVSTAPASPTPSSSGSGATDPQGCPIGDAGNIALATQLDRSLVIEGTTRIALTTAGIQARNGSWGADDSIPQFATLDLGASPVTIPRGSSVTVDGSPGMQLSGGDAKAWLRSQLASLPEVTGDAVALVTVPADGQLAVRLPDAVGTYVVELHPLWATSCLVGDGIAYLVVETR